MHLDANDIYVLTSFAFMHALEFRCEEAARGPFSLQLQCRLDRVLPYKQKRLMAAGECTGPLSAGDTGPQKKQQQKTEMTGNSSISFSRLETKRMECLAAVVLERCSAGASASTAYGVFDAPCRPRMRDRPLV